MSRCSGTPKFRLSQSFQVAVGVEWTANHFSKDQQPRGRILLPACAMAVCSTTFLASSSWSEELSVLTSTSVCGAEGGAAGRGDGDGGRNGGAGKDAEVDTEAGGTTGITSMGRDRRPSLYSRKRRAIFTSTRCHCSLRVSPSSDSPVTCSYHTERSFRKVSSPAGFPPSSPKRYADVVAVCRGADIVGFVLATIEGSAYAAARMLVTIKAARLGHARSRRFSLFGLQLCTLIVQALQKFETTCRKKFECLHHVTLERPKAAIHRAATARQLRWWPSHQPPGSFLFAAATTAVVRARTTVP
eukprot:1938011-Prymnesium_polylepis.1